MSPQYATMGQWARGCRGRMDLQTLSIVISTVVGVVIPAVVWAFKAAVVGRLDTLAQQVQRVEGGLRAVDVAMAVLGAARLPERLPALEVRLCQIEERIAALPCRVAPGGGCGVRSGS